MAKNTYYFPHDYHARHDPKLERLRMELGPVSDGIFWDIVEMLYEEGGYLFIKDIPLYAKMLNTNEQVLNEVVNEMFMTDKDKFYSQSLLDRLNHINGVIEQRRFAGKASGKARQMNTCSTPVKHLSNNINKIREIKEKNIVPPTHEMVSKYCLEQKNGIDPRKFIDHYTANDWMRGKNKIKDWQACIRTWERSDRPIKQGMNVL